MTIKLQRVYEPIAAGPGKRILVDRVWPRGIKKDELRLDLWLKDLAPSTPLRKWFGHDPKRWDEFQRRYWAELHEPAKQARLQDLIAMARKGSVTLMYGAHDKEHNQAVVLRQLLQESLRR